jgi:hypothetical protein
VNPEPVRASDLESGLRNVRRGSLALLAVCALVIATTASPVPGPAPSLFPIAAIAFGLASVLARHAAVATRGRARVWCALASPLLAAGVGLVGVVLALQDGPRTTALVYVLGGALLCLRPALGPARR